MATCGKCGQKIQGAMLGALGKKWHKDCFACTICNKSLQGQTFHEKDGQPHCKKCYNEKYAPKCARCNEVISGNWITAMDKNWHSECFTCFSCNKEFDEEEFTVKDDQPYCTLCYTDLFLGRCTTCGKALTGSIVTALGHQYHEACFVCAGCKEPFPENNFYESNEMAYCEKCHSSIIANRQQ